MNSHAHTLCRSFSHHLSTRALSPSTVRGRGYNIGLRLIDDFLANSGVGKCQDFKETMDVISKVHTPLGNDVLHMQPMQTCSLAISRFL